MVFLDSIDSQVINKIRNVFLKRGNAKVIDSLSSKTNQVEVTWFFMFQHSELICLFMRLLRHLNVDRRSAKKAFLKILQNSQDNTHDDACAEVSF